MKTNKLLLTPSGFKTWELAEDFEIVTKQGTFIIPKGFITDLASTPRFLWSILPPFGRYSVAALVHDYLYRIGYDKKLADKVFYELMIKHGTYKWKAKVMYYGVKLFGFKAYNYYKKQKLLSKTENFINKN